MAVHDVRPRLNVPQTMHMNGRSWPARDLHWSVPRWLDATHLASFPEQNRILWEQAKIEGRLVSAEDYDEFPEWIRPFDPAHRNGGALNRPRIRFPFGQLDHPWLPEDKRLPPLPKPSFEVWLSTDEEIDPFFQRFQEYIDQSTIKPSKKN